MKEWLFFFFVLMLGIIQAALPGFLKIFNAQPELILTAVVLGVLALDTKWAVSLSVFAGVFKDIFSGNTFGINTILFLCWGLLIKRLAREISIENNFRRLVLILAVVLLHNSIIGLILVYSGRSVPPGIFLGNVFFVLLYTAAVLPLVFKLIRNVSPELF